MNTKTRICGGVHQGRSALRSGAILRAAAVLSLAAAGFGCGDQFRPVALPIAAPTPSPAPSQFVAAIASNGVTDPGSEIRIDVSGDSVASAFTTGVAPVYAAWLPSGTKIYVANSGEDTVSASSTSSTTSATTITLPQLCSGGSCSPSRPVFVNSTENGNMYVANSGNGTVAVINATSDVVVAEVAVDPAFAGSPLPAPNTAAVPIALAELPNGQKIYSVNQGNSTVTSISTVDDTLAAPPIHIGAPPIWAVASSDSADVYVLDSSGTISVIDTLADAVVGPPIPVGAGANFMFLDPAGNRLYVTNPNPASRTVSVFDVAGKVLTPHAASPVVIPTAAGSVCASAPQPTSVTVLGDGTRAYVASFQADPGGAVCAQATVINAGTGLVSSTIPLSVAADNSALTQCGSARFRVSASVTPNASASSTKVFISQCDAGAVAVIDTFASNTGTNQHPPDFLEANIPISLASSPGSEIGISAASQSSGATTYTYTLLSGPALQVGDAIVVSGMNDAGNNGSFVISGMTATTFTVANPMGVTTSAAQGGNGSVVPAQNPVFVAAAP